MEIEIILSLVPIAKRGALEKMIYITSKELAKDINTSQQTANRRIRLLEKKGYIKRSGSSKRQQIVITDDGKIKLKEVFFSLYDLFRKQENEVRLNGRLISGMGEGKYYISRVGYRNQFIKKLGFSPYPGTLNLIIDDETLARFQATIKNLLFIKIENFKTENRTFGGVKAYKAEIGNKIKGAVILPYRTHHRKNILEVVAPVFLRKELNIKDGDIIDVTIFG
ncbi:MAG: DUF120 domain-containing protein [Candidatus Methanofastidiosia archaeon]